ncbi:MAG: hypothetical protein AMXMBFR33_72270 [Candidatus Xenobia bacterium]
MGLDWETFRKRLGETIAWCSGRPAAQYWWPRLRPGLLCGDRAETVRNVASNRHIALRRDVPPASGLEGGRLLLYFPDQNLFDGAARVSTDGFFDDDNVPPWDTWVDFLPNLGLQECLVVWIAPEMLELAEVGLAVNPECCIQWLEDEPPELVSRLRAEGFLSPQSQG